jgi:putative addiction module component (TIGR02574 family)
MPSTAEQITSDALRLPDEARARLVHTLLLSLEPADHEDGVEEAWDEEIARRVERVKQGTATGRPAEEVFRDIRARN